MMATLSDKKNSSDARVDGVRGLRAKRSDVEYAPHNGSVIDKIAKYGWTMADDPGEFRLIHKDDLMADPDYQREEVESKVNAIASDWSWKACGALLVARRDDGSLYVFDGNHRAVAARKRSDIAELPCLVFRVGDVSQEAVGFLRSNVNRKPITAFDRFKALILTGDVAAVMVDRLVRESGLHFSRDSGGPRSVFCVGTLLRAANTYPAILKKIWPILVELSEEGGLHERVVDALVYIEVKISKSDKSLLDHPWRERLTRLGRNGIVDAAAKAASFYARGGAKVWASGVVEAMNKGLRNRLSIGDISTKEED